MEAGIPNSFAYAILVLWPALCALFFMRMPPQKAILWSVFGGFLLLPTSTFVNLPGLPNLTKYLSIELGVLFGLLRYPLRGSKSDGSGIYRLLAAIYILTPFLTAYTNRDAFTIGAAVIKEYNYYDAMSTAFIRMLTVVPFFAARKFLAGEDGHIAILRAFVLAMLAYSILVLFEVRFSPQLHSWVYGFKQFSFGQQTRYGGFRAVVFLAQGLVVALLIGQALVAAMVLRRQPWRVFGVPVVYAVPYLAVVMLLQKSLGSAVIAALLCGAVWMLSPRKQLFLAAIVGLMLCSYPLLRSAGFAPTQGISALSAQLDPSRAQSFDFRLLHEEALLARAEQRPYFGWGGWGRGFIRDPITGRSESVLDGAWIIIFGETGWLGYLSSFGMFALPLLRLRKGDARAGGKTRPVSQYTAGLALVLIFGLLDSIPNYGISAITWMIAGALSAYRPGTAMAASSPRKEPEEGSGLPQSEAA